MRIDALLRRVPVHPEVAAAFEEIPYELNELGYDPWGFNYEIAQRAYTIGRAIYRYFRPSVSGIDNLPEGRVLIIANHAGQLPMDGIVAWMACLLDAKPPRIVRSMVERVFPTLPVVSELMARSGAVVGDPINCRNLLEADNVILVFPEGARGAGKLWNQRYQLTRFGRGFMRLALQTGTPIVPLAVVGSEETIPTVANIAPLARALNVPYVPVPMLLPLLGPLAYVPLPARFYLRFGEPMTFEGAFDDEDEVIQDKVERVRGTIQDMVDTLRAERPSIF